jgi:hypothetical protein
MNRMGWFVALLASCGMLAIGTAAAVAAASEAENGARTPGHPTTISRVVEAGGDGVDNRTRNVLAAITVHRRY